MFVNDNLRRCVVFVGAKRREDFQIGGTAFITVMPIEESDGYRLYLVTAKHVVTEAAARSIDGCAYIRANTKDGASEWQRIDASTWEFHLDDRVDAAAAPLYWTQEEFFTKYGHNAVVGDSFVDDDMIHKFEIRAGEGLFFPGLFTRVPGMQSNLPIIRTGTIAALPDRSELIHTRLGIAWVYLAEIRSIGGHSGSPVFVHFDIAKDTLMQQRGLTMENYPCLGLVHGHFPIREDQFSAHVVPPGQQNISETFTKHEADFSSGIAAIVPAQLIRELLLQPALVAERAKQRKKTTGPI